MLGIEEAGVEIEDPFGIDPTACLSTADEETYRCTVTGPVASMSSTSGSVWKTSTSRRSDNGNWSWAKRVVLRQRWSKPPASSRPPTEDRLPPMVGNRSAGSKRKVVAEDLAFGRSVLSRASAYRK